MKRMIAILPLCIVLLCVTLLSACSNSMVNGTDSKQTQNEYINNISVIEYDGIVYCADKTGLWKLTAAGEKEYLYDLTPARYLAVNGSTILFSTYEDGELTSGTYLDSHCAVHSVNIDGTDEKKLLDTIDLAKPICKIGEVLYYIDIKDVYSVESLAQTTWLKSYDIGSQEETPLAENAQEAVSCGNHIIYKNMGLSVESRDMLLHDYDTVSGSDRTLSDVSASGIKMLDNKLYFANYSFDESDSVISIYSYDIHSESDPAQIISFDAESPLLRAYDTEKAFFQTSDFISDDLVTTNYVMDYASGDITEISDLPGDMSFNVALCDDGALFIDYDTKRSYYFDGTQSYYVGEIVEDGYNYSYHCGYLFAINDENELLYSSWSFSEDEIKPEPTEKTVDYSSYLGWWGKDYGNYAGVGVNFHSFDKDMATFDIQLSTANANRLVGTDTIEAQIVDNQIDFSFHDSFDNYGSGTIILQGDSVSLKASTDGTVHGYGLNCEAELEKDGWGGFY